MSSTTTATQVAELVRALALAWKNLAAYPPGHPALVGSVERAHHRLTELRGPGGDVAFGISRDGLLYGDEKIDSAHAQKFAQALYTRGVALVRFAAATAPRDLEIFLRSLGGSAPLEQRPPIWEELTAAGVVNIHLQPVDYSAVQVTDDLTAPPKAEPASLWDDILRALLVGRELSLEGRRLLDREVHSVNEVAMLVFEYLKALGQEQNKPEFDPDATFGIRMKPPGADPEAIEAVSIRVADAVGLHVQRSTGLRKQLAVQQVAQLLRSLPEPMRGAVIRSVMRVLATDESTGSLLRDFTTTLPQDEVLEALQYLSSVSNLSSHAMTLLQSLSAIEQPKQEIEPGAPMVLTDLIQLFGEDDVDRFNPEDHRSLLTAVAVDVPRLPGGTRQTLDRLGDRVETVTDDAVNLQLGRTLVELLRRYGAAQDPSSILQRLEAVVRSNLSAGLFAAALDGVTALHHLAADEATSKQLRELIDQSISRLAGPDTIDTLVESLHTAPPESATAIQRLIEAMGGAASRSLLIALAEEENRSRRRRLFDVVASLGNVIVPEATRFLSDSRWYVVRNMILLLRSVNDRTSLPEIRRAARHADLRVRLEAIKTLLAFDPSVPRSLLEQAINDPDPKMAEAAVALVGSYGIKEGVDSLLKILEKPDVLGRRRSLRLKAIRALGELGDPRALRHLERFFKESLLPWPSRAERRAAYESLSFYPRSDRTPLAERGLKSRDRQIRDVSKKVLAAQ